MRVRPPTLYFHAAPPPGGRLGPVSLGLPSRLGLLGDPAPTGLLVTPGLYDVIEVVALGPRAPAGRPGCGGRLLLGLAAAMRPVGRQLRDAGENRVRCRSAARCRSVRSLRSHPAAVSHEARTRSNDSRGPDSSAR